MTTLIVQEWTETERGWGQRPDGISIHLTEADRVAYVKAYWDSMPKSVPDEYSFDSGYPYLVDRPDNDGYVAALNDDKVKPRKYGLRYYRVPQEFKR